MGVVARSDRDKYSGWPPPIKAEPPKQEPGTSSEGLVTMARKRRKAEKVADDDGA